MTADPQIISVKTETIHGCAVAIGEKGLLILGESGAGKSRLIVDLLADKLIPCARLVADDRVILSKHSNQLIARPHPLIAGRIEIRSLGIRDFPYLEAVVLHAVIRLMPNDPPRMPDVEALSYTSLGITLPFLSLPIQSFSAQHLRAIWPHLK